MSDVEETEMAATSGRGATPCSADEVRDTFYSTNDEDFYHSCFEDAAQSIWDDNDHSEGDEVTIYEMEFRRCLPSRFIPWIGEQMIERAWDEWGDHADQWEFSAEEEDRLQKAVAKFVDEWMTENKLECPLWEPIGKSSELRFRFVGDTGDVVPVEPNVV